MCWWKFQLLLDALSTLSFQFLVIDSITLSNLQHFFPLQQVSPNFCSKRYGHVHSFIQDTKREVSRALARAAATFQPIVARHLLLCVCYISALIYGHDHTEGEEKRNRVKQSQRVSGCCHPRPQRRLRPAGKLLREFGKWLVWCRGARS